ncbi:MAG TPA: MarR family transcriptional regulator [Trebonia sp.]|nr:MarR family transcriptional regulator [Trebonia sp.]
MSKDDKTGDEQAVRQIAGRLRVAMGAFNRRSREASSQGDLSSSQLTALSRLDRLGPLTTAELARVEQMTPQAMGTTIAGLVNLGLVQRGSDPADARRSIISLTDAGQTAIREGRNALADRVAEVLTSSFTAEEIVVLAAATPLIERLADVL